MKPDLPPFQRGGGFGTLGTDFNEPALPDRVSLAPETWGAWLSALVLIASLILLALWFARRTQQNQHRRVARRELNALHKAWRAAAATERAQLLNQLPRLLKGCALGSYERPRVAKLAGASWLSFLRSTAPTAGFEGAAGETLVALCERGALAVSDDAVPALFHAVERWIAGHRV